MSIETEILRIEAAKSNIASAITDKGVTVPSDALLGNMPDLIAAIEVTSSSESSDTVVGSGAITVRFVDPISGIFLTHKVDAGDDIDLTAITAPTYPNLTFQGWNMSSTDLSNIQNDIDVGAMYITTSGLTEIDYESSEYGGMTPTLSLATTGTYITVNWGDGQSTTGASGSFAPTNPIANGSYTLTINSDGVLSFTNNTTNTYLFGQKHYQSSPKTVRLGSAVTTIGSYVFSTCYDLSCMVLPSNVTRVGDYSFYLCYALRAVVIPSSTTYIGISAFRGVAALKVIAIPNSVLSIETYALSYCTALSSVILHDGISTVANNLLRSSTALLSIRIPASTTAIEYYALTFCYGLVRIDLSAVSTVPTLSGAILTVNDALKIIVPSALLSSFKSATYWSTYADYMVGV